VEVPEGYAVNFLFPEHLAAPALHAAVEDAPPLKVSAQERAEQQLAGGVDGLEVVVERKIKNGKFVDPVTVQDIVKEIRRLGYSIDKTWMKCRPITEPKNEEIKIHFPTGYEAAISLICQAA
jgi:ribosomal protein L9